MNKMNIMLGVAAICGCAAFDGGLGTFDSAWTEEVDLSKAKVYVSADATVPEVEAAKMLMRAQKMVAGGTYAESVDPLVAQEWPADGVIVGWHRSALLAPVAEELALRDWKDVKNYGDEIVQAKRGNVYVLAGNSPEGAFYAVADVLYRNGARAIHSGGKADGFRSGLYLEWMTALKAPASRKYVPYVALRTGFAIRPNGKDFDEVGANLFAVMNGATPHGRLCGGRGRTSIGCESIQPPVVQFEKHKDWFPLVDGKRWRPYGGWDWIVNGCYMNDDFKDWVVESQYDWFAKRLGGYDMVTDVCLTDSDGGRDCDCDGCRKLRADYPGSDWYWKEHGEINRMINLRIPGLRNYTFAYGHGQRFPRAGKALVAHLDAIQYCPHQRCYVHPYAVKCPTNRADMDRAEEWRKAEIPIGDFDYCYDVFNPAMNMPSWNITWDVVRYWKELNGERGVPSIYMEGACGGGCGGKSRASVYAVARALWDCAETPAETHLRDFVRCAYADPAKPAFSADSPESQMLAWYLACAKAWESQKAHLTATFNNPTGTAKAYFNEGLVTSGEAAFAAAEQAIRARLAPEGTPVEKMNRAQYLAWKQYETWKFEKKVAYDEWKALRVKALSASMEINLETGDASDVEFGRAVAIPLQVKAWNVNVPSNELPRVTAKLYRTDKALRVRFDVTAPAFKPLAAKPKDGDNFDYDHVELFLQAAGRSDYFHLSASPDGVRYDALCMDSKFGSDKWRCETQQKDGFVSYTFTIDWSIFGDGFRPKAGESVKFLADVSVRVPKQKNGVWQVYAGLPRVAFHDLGVAADLLIDDNAGRRAGGK